MKAFSSIVIRVLMVLRVFQAKIISYEELLANIITKRHERSPRPPGVDRVQTLAACNRTRHEVRRAFEPVGMSEASKHCTDSTDSTDCTDSMSMWPSSFFLTWSRHDCIIGPHVLLRCREQCNHLNLAIEKQQYQWFQEIINVLRLGKKNRLCHSNTNWKANKIVIYQLYWTLSSYPFKSTLWSKSLCNSTNIFQIA